MKKRVKKTMTPHLVLKLQQYLEMKINENLPISSTLGKKQSDFIGQINFS